MRLFSKSPNDGSGPSPIDFDGIHTTDEALNTLSSLQEYLIDPEDDCVVERGAEGNVNIAHAVELTACGVVSDGSWGAMWACWLGFSSSIRSLERQLVRLPALAAC